MTFCDSRVIILWKTMPERKATPASIKVGQTGASHPAWKGGVNKNQYRRDRDKKLRLAAIDLLGGKCCQCGFSDLRALQFDHVNGGGSQDRKTGNVSHIALDVIKHFEEETNKYQLLCANCNWIKRHVNNENPKRVD